MITQNNRSRFLELILIFSFILLADIITIIMLIYVAPHFDFIGIPDLFIYPKTLVDLTVLLVSILYLKKKIPNVRKAHLRTLVLIAFAFILVYAMTLYTYKYFLITFVMDSIRTMIQGPSSLYLYKTLIHYPWLNYVSVIFGSANSEFFMMITSLAVFWWLMRMDKIEVVAEEKKPFDEFVLSRSLFPTTLLLTVMTFLSINLFRLSYTWLEGIEVIIGLTAFMLIIPGFISALKIRNTSNYQYPDYIKSNYQKLKVTTLINFILMLGLVGLNVYLNILGMGTYRSLTTVVSLVLSLYLFIKTHRVDSLI